MDRSDVIILVGVTARNDDYLVPQKIPTRTTVFCRVGSVSLQEANTAGQGQLRPAFRFTVLAQEYSGEPEIIYRGQTYSVYRTYRATRDTLELYAEGKGGV